MDLLNSLDSFWTTGVTVVVFPVLAAISVIVISTQLYQHFVVENHVTIRDTKRHNWKSSQLVGEATHCSICENLLNTRGYYCDSCGVAADSTCLKTADKTLKCKDPSINEHPMKHHWVKGNLPSHNHACAVCEDPCEDVGIVHFQCCWCHAMVHKHCFPKLSQICDFGRFRQLIVPPYCVKVTRHRSSISQRLLLSSVSSPGWPDWTPLIVVGIFLSK